MLCKMYSELSHVDKIKYIGEVIHIVQNDDAFFDLGRQMIELAKEKGILDGITILPPENNNNNQVKE